MKLSVIQSLRAARIPTWSSSAFVRASATVVAAAAKPARLIAHRNDGFGARHRSYGLKGFQTVREGTPMPCREGSEIAMSVFLLPRGSRRD
jgi:hypothetical protein